MACGFFLPGVKGIGRRFRFMRWKPSPTGLTAHPLGDVLGPTEKNGSVACDELHRDSGPGFHLNPLRRHGEGRRGGFLFAPRLRVAGRHPLTPPTQTRQTPA